MKLTNITKILSLLASIVMICLLVFASLKIIDMVGLGNKRMETIREYSVKYDQIPRLDEKMAHKIRKANQDHQRAFAWLGGGLIVILGAFVIYVKATSQKNK